MAPSPSTGRRGGRARGSQRSRVPVWWLVPTTAIAVGVAAVLIVVTAATRSDDEGDPIGASQAPDTTQRLCASGAVAVDSRICGDDSAPVKIVELSDYQCPFCKLFADTTEPEVEREYIQNGLVQLEFRNFAITGGSAPADSNESTLAAEAAECANDQGRFWEYHYKLFAEQSGENEGAFLPHRLKQFATDLGLDRDEFDACLDSHKHIGLIVKERDEAIRAGAQGTPSFLIDGKLIVGYQPFDEFRTHIEEALAER